MEVLTIETGPFDDPPPTPNRRRRRVVASIVVAIAALAAVAFVRADGSNSKTTEVVAEPRPPADLAPAPSIYSSTSSGSASSAAPSIYSSTLSGTMPAGAADPLQWVLQSCLADNGFSPPTGPVSSEADARATQTKMAEAYRACRDFLPPVNLPPAQERLYACLRENGVDVDPRMPPAPVTDSDVVRRAATACRALVPESPAGMPPAYRDYMNCMADNGVFVDLPIAIDAATRNAATEKCAALLPTPTLPPEQEKYFACLTSNGVAANVSKPASPTSVQSEVDPETARAAAQACRSLRPPNGAPPGYTDYINCMEDHGVIQGAPVRSSQSAMQAASAACRQHQPKPTLPPPFEAYAKCLGENGLEVEFFGDAPSPTYDPAVAAAAAKACREQRPTSGAPSSSVEFTNCMEEHGALTSVPVRVPETVSREASQACASFLPKPSGPPSLPSEVQKWYDCLIEHGITVTANAKPDYDVARAAAKACESLRTKAVYSTSD